MRMFLLATAALMAGPASAGTVLFSEDFDSITANTLQITGTVGSMDVIGAVDAVVPMNSFGINAPSTVIDLDGTPGPGAVSKGGFNLIAGRTYTLSFVAGGAQRNSSGDSLIVGLFSDESFAMSTVGGTGLFAFVNPFLLGQNFFATISSLPGSTPFTASSIIFKANNNTSFAFQIGSASADNIGPLLDSVMLTQNAVPEPASWAMLIAGFGLVGAAQRRRKLALAA